MTLTHAFEFAASINSYFEALVGHNSRQQFFSVPLPFHKFMGTELLFRFGFVNILEGELLFPIVSLILRTRTFFLSPPPRGGDWI